MGSFFLGMETAPSRPRWIRDVPVPSSIAIGDVNEDENRSHHGDYLSSTVSILLGNGAHIPD
jgi:hypothetical protein